MWMINERTIYSMMIVCVNVKMNAKGSVCMRACISTIKASVLFRILFHLMPVGRPTEWIKKEKKKKKKEQTNYFTTNKMRIKMKYTRRLCALLYNTKYGKYRMKREIFSFAWHNQRSVALSLSVCICVVVCVRPRLLDNTDGTGLL